MSRLYVPRQEVTSLHRNKWHRKWKESTGIDLISISQPYFFVKIYLHIILYLIYTGRIYWTSDY